MSAKSVINNVGLDDKVLANCCTYYVGYGRIFACHKLKSDLRQKAWPVFAWQKLAHWLEAVTSSVSLTRVRGKSAAGQAQPLTSDLRDVTCKQKWPPKQYCKKNIEHKFWVFEDMLMF